MTISKTFVAGAGAMGHGIAQVAITAGIDVTLYDLSDDILKAARQKIQWSLDKLSDKGKLTEPVETILARLSLTNDLQRAAAAEHVIEVVPEQEAIKRDLFEKLDQICPAKTIFTTNTSAIPIATLAGCTTRGDRFCGTHFFIPVPLMPLVEIIRGPATSDETFDTISQWVLALGKTPIDVARDVAGFVVNRVLLAACVEAIDLLEAGVASAEDIDKAMQLGCNWRMGPLATCDYAGLDVMLHALQVIDSASDGQRFTPPALLLSLVDQGKLGRKTGEGFFKYESK